VDCEGWRNGLANLECEVRARAAQSELDAIAQSTKAEIAALTKEKTSLQAALTALASNHSSLQSTIASNHSSLEAALKTMEAAVQASSAENEKLLARASILEESISKKVDAGELHAMDMQIQEQEARCSAMDVLQNQQAALMEQTDQNSRTKLVALEAALMEQTDQNSRTKPVALEARDETVVQWEAKLVSLETKLTSSMELMTSLQEEIYPRQEIDRMWTRIWCRMGELSGLTVQRPPGAAPTHSCRPASATVVAQPQQANAAQLPASTGHMPGSTAPLQGHTAQLPHLVSSGQATHSSAGRAGCNTRGQTVTCRSALSAIERQS